MPLYTVTACVWADSDDVDYVEAQIADLFWENFDDVPACDVDEFREP